MKKFILCSLTLLTSVGIQQNVLSMEPADESDKSDKKIGAAAHEEPIEKTCDLNKQLLDAAKAGNSEQVLELIAAGADVNAHDEHCWTHSMRSCLMSSVRNGHTEIVQRLNAQKNNGDTALILAAKNGHTNIVQELISAGAHINAQNNEGATALTYASYNGHTETVEQLFVAGADVNAQTKSYFTAILLATFKGHTAIVKSLVAAKAKVNIQNNNGYTPLIAAANCGHIDIVEALCEAFADATLRNNDGLSALDKAHENNHQIIVEMLEEYVHNGGIGLGPKAAFKGFGPAAHD
jgi:uncharacterized protein